MTARKASPERSFENAVAAGARRAGLGGHTVLCAVSGGPDSVALLVALARRREALGLARLGVAHVDHGLRPTSPDDAALVARLADQLELPFALLEVSVDVRAAGLEAGARAARYAALLGAAQALDYEVVATGHTRTDQAETVLLRLLRGSGLRGLSAMAWNRRLAPAAAIRLARPLLALSAGDTRAYVAALELAVAADPSNADRRLLRNALRLDLWPQLLSLQPAAERRLAELAAQSREDEAALEALARAAYLALALASADHISLPAPALSALPPAVGRRVVRRCLRALRPDSQPSALHLRAVLTLCRRGGKGEVHLAGDLAASVRRNRLVFAERPVGRAR